jgi:hypothetical protein
VLILEQHVAISDGAAHATANVLATFDNADLTPSPPE